MREDEEGMPRWYYTGEEEIVVKEGDMMYNRPRPTSASSRRKRPKSARMRDRESKARIAYSGGKSKSRKNVSRSLVFSGVYSTFENKCCFCFYLLLATYYDHLTLVCRMDYMLLTNIIDAMYVDIYMCVCVDRLEG